MTAWLFVLVPLTALLIWAWVLDRRRNKRAALASDHLDDSAARKAGVHPYQGIPPRGTGKPLSWEAETGGERLCNDVRVVARSLPFSPRGTELLELADLTVGTSGRGATPAALLGCRRAGKAPERVTRSTSDASLLDGVCNRRGEVQRGRICPCHGRRRP